MGLLIQIQFTLISCFLWLILFTPTSKTGNSLQTAGIFNFGEKVQLLHKILARSDENVESLRISSVHEVSCPPTWVYLFRFLEGKLDSCQPDQPHVESVDEENEEEEPEALIILFSVSFEFEIDLVEVGDAVGQMMELHLSCEQNQDQTAADTWRTDTWRFNQCKLIINRRPILLNMRPVLLNMRPIVPTHQMYNLKQIMFMVLSELQLPHLHYHWLHSSTLTCWNLACSHFNSAYTYVTFV